MRDEESTYPNVFHRVNFTLRREHSAIRSVVSFRERHTKFGINVGEQHSTVMLILAEFSLEGYSLSLT